MKKRKQSVLCLKKNSNFSKMKMIVLSQYNPTPPSLWYSYCLHISLLTCRQLRDDIDNFKKKCKQYTDDTCCSYCGIKFGVIMNRAASCPICNKRVCKLHRLYGSRQGLCSDSWMCTLCDMRK